MTDDRTGVALEGCDLRHVPGTQVRGLLFLGVFAENPGAMLFLTASTACGDVDARAYEERGTAALDVETRRFELGTPAANAATHASLVTLLGNLPDRTAVLASSTVVPLLGNLFRNEARRLRLVVIAHRPSHRDPRFAGIADAELLTVDRTTLPFARRVIVPSLHTAMSLGACGVLPDQLAVVLPGADKAPVAEGSRDGMTLLCPSPLVPSAGHDVLLEALASLAKIGWRLVCAAPEGDAEWTTRLRRDADRLRIADRVSWAVNVGPGDLKAAYYGADLVVLPARYDVHGSGALEALARGLPICAANAGAASALVPEGAGVLVRPESPPELSRTLAVLLETPGALRSLAARSAAARDDLRPWSRVGAEMKREVELACR